MSIIISHGTAADFWQHARMLPARVGNPVRPPRNDLALTRQLEATDLRSLGIPAGPVDLLVSDGWVRSVPAGLRVHRHAGALPVGALVDLGRDVLLSGPELTFVQMAARLSLYQLIRFGCELCGSFALPRDTSDHLVRRPALTTAAALRQLCASCANDAGLLNARRAARYVVEGVESPAEATMALLVCLPNAMGGYGLRGAVANHAVRLSEAASRLYEGRATCRCDLFFPRAAVALEYDSDAHHGNATRRASDIAREKALREMGVTVVSVSTTQLYDVERFDDVVRYLAKLIGQRLRLRVEGFETRRHALRTELFRDGLLTRT